MTTGYAASFEPAMRAALAEASAALAMQPPEVPVGAVVLDAAGTITGRGHNRREADADPTAHAEIVAIRAAAAAAGDWRLTGCTLVVTLEPCTMCAGAISAARLARLVYGTADPRAGAAGSLWDVLRDRRLDQQTEVIAGVLEDECSRLLRELLRQPRPGRLRPQAALRHPVTGCGVRRDRPSRQVGSAAVESPSGRGRTPRKRVRGQPLRGFKSHLHRPQPIAAVRASAHRRRSPPWHRRHDPCRRAAHLEGTEC